TYRIMARQLVDRVEEKLAREFGVRPSRGCETDRLTLAGGTLGGVDLLLAREVEGAAREHGLEGEEVASYLIGTYGTGYAQVLEFIRRDPSLGQPIVPGLPYLWAEVPHAIQYEMALTLSDFMIRRTHLIYEEKSQGLEQAPGIAARMAYLLGWGGTPPGGAGPRQVEAQVEGYRREVEFTRQYKNARS
ncbi:MAG: hypothetical protein HY673_03520, partial [Chloroflexi bacterium]|nr:hypothetical protein [Chloroflexota bacterium]